MFLITTWAERFSLLPPEVAGEELGVFPEGATVLLPREVGGGEELEEVESPCAVVSVVSVVVAGLAGVRVVCEIGVVSKLGDVVGPGDVVCKLVVEPAVCVVGEFGVIGVVPNGSVVELVVGLAGRTVGCETVV